MAALQPLMSQAYDVFFEGCANRWNAVIDATDEPGCGGGGYAAGAAVLNAHIEAIKTYKNNKGW